MKKIIKLSVLLVIITGIFSSCKKDDSTPPVLQFIQTADYTYQDVNLAPGDSVKIGLSCTSNGSDALDRLTSTVNEQNVGIFSFPDAQQNGTLETWLVKSALDLDIWVFELYDVKGNSSSVTISLTKDLSLADVEDITGIVLGAQDNTTDKPIYSITNNTAYTFAEIGSDNAIQAKIDFACYSDDKNGTHLAPPNANWSGTTYEANFNAWTTKNEVSFILDTPFELAEFDILTKTKIKTAYDNAEEADPEVVKRKSKEMVADKMYLFKTYDGKYGVLKVNSITTGTTGSVNFDIKIEK